MKLATIDFESYYGTDYSLKKMTTEAYIRDPRFQTIGVSIKLGNVPARWVPARPGRIEAALAEIDWKNTAVLAHNTRFDAAILEWQYGVQPAFYFDTMSMARAIHGLEGALSLAALVERYGLGVKGNEVVNAKDKRLEDFAPDELARYGEYCVNDSELTYKLLHALLRARNGWKFPTSELAVIDLMLRMFVRPSIQLDDQALHTHLDTVRARKEKLLAKVEQIAGKDALMSNDKLAKILQSLGVEPPMKLSPAALKRGEEKLTYAFGKSDLEFKALLDHDDERVQAVVAARMGVKSTQAETRALTFIGIAERGPLPVPLGYYNAHTGRAGGEEKINLQNLPARTGDLSLRRALCAPPGHSIVTCDSAQIEARVLAYLAGEWGLVEDFRNGVDIYSDFATDVYGYPVNRKLIEIGEDGKEFYPFKKEGMVGKECVAGWTPVLTERGWVPIARVTQDDRVWDGGEWVHHDGVLDQGTKEVIWTRGLCATPDHEILTERGWVAWREVSTDETLFQQARSLVGSPYSDTNGMSTAEVVRHGSQSLHASVGGREPSYTAAWRSDCPPGVSHVGERPQQRNGTGATGTPCRTTPTGCACSTACLPQYRAATMRITSSSATTAGGASLCTPSGGKIAQRFSAIYKQFRGGTTLLWRWIVSTSTWDTCRATSGSVRAARTWPTADGWTILSSESGSWKLRTRVYDLANAGQSHRFTVLTDTGPVIVSNCILGLGFGMGAPKFRLRLKQSVGIDMSEADTERTVGIYRRRFARVKKLWSSANAAIKAMVNGYEYTLGVGIKLQCYPADEHGPARILLPNGMFLRYPELRAEAGGKFGVEYKYTARKGRKVEAVYIHGAKLVENVVQALARIIVFDQLVEIDRWMSRQGIAPGEHLAVAMTVHDEGDAVAPDHMRDETKATMLKVMSTPPRWAPDLPIAAEAGSGKNYGDA